MPAYEAVSSLSQDFTHFLHWLELLAGEHESSVKDRTWAGRSGAVLGHAAAWPVRPTGAQLRSLNAATAGNGVLEGEEIGMSSESGARWLSVSEVSRVLGVPQKSVRCGRLRQQLGFVKVGRHLRLRPEALAAFAAKAEPRTDRA